MYLFLPQEDTLELGVKAGLHESLFPVQTQQRDFEQMVAECGDIPVRETVGAKEKEVQSWQKNGLCSHSHANGPNMAFSWEYLILVTE